MDSPFAFPLWTDKPFEARLARRGRFPVTYREASSNIVESVPIPVAARSGSVIAAEAV